MLGLSHALSSSKHEFGEMTDQHTRGGSYVEPKKIWPGEMPNPT